MELSEVYSAIAALVSDEEGSLDEEKLKAFVKGLRGHDNAGVKAVAQRLVNTGAKLTKTEKDQRIRELTQEVESLTSERDSLREAAEASKGQPSEREADLDKKLKRAETRLKEVEAERDAERHGRAEDKVALSRSAFLGHLKGRVDDFGLKAVANEFGARFRPKDDGTVEVLDDDGIPIEAPKGKTPEQILAEHAYESVPDSNRVRNMNTGGGGNRGGAGGTVTAEQIAAEKQRTRDYQRF